MAAAVAALALVVAIILVLRQRPPAFRLEVSPDQNILLITIDTLRADALSSYGGRARTPNLDRLAGHGARFTFAHAHAVVTLPSHTSILTGQLPYEHGMRDNSGFRVKDGTATVARVNKQECHSGGPGRTLMFGTGGIGGRKAKKPRPEGTTGGPAPAPVTSSSNHQLMRHTS